MRTEKELGQRLAYILANSFKDIQFLSWSNNSLYVNNNEENVFLMIIDYAGSGLIKINSRPYFGLDGYHNYFQLPKGELKITVEMSPYKAFGQKVAPNVGTPVKYRRNESAYLLWVYGTTTLELAKESPEHVKQQLLQVLTDTLKLTPFVSVSRDQLFLASKYTEKFPSYLLDYSQEMSYREYSGDYREALEYLKDKISVLGPKIGSLSAVSHAHIDTAWLWPFGETKRKVARTFSTVLTLMEKYDFTYIQSMALYYEWVKQEYPELFEKIRRRVKEGKWILGAGWVEFDSNIPSGESIARQLLYSQKYYLENFGKTAEVLWLPDTFGFSAQLPQLMKLARISAFATHKVFWNDTNRFPYSIFRWVGIDGTGITAIAFGNGDGGYNSTFSVHSVMDQWSNWRDKDQPMLYSYGYGDGGGGPTEEMLIKSKVISELPYLPKVNHGFPEPTPKNTWSGEMYLETHRGVLTSHSKMKYLHRRAEVWLREAEFWSTIAGSYDRERFESLWRILLKNEFHDVLPGSAINDVYKEVYPEMERIIDESRNIALSSMKRIVGGGDELYVFNSLSWDREDYIVIDKEVENSQKVGDGYLVKVRVPSVGYSIFHPEKVKEEERVRVNGLTIENNFVRIALNESGEVVSLFDKEVNRELLKSAGRLVFYENIPGWADAWDIEGSYKDTYFALKAYKSEVVEQGPLRGCARFYYRFRDSDIVEDIYVYAGSKRVDFKITTRIPDRELLLKFWFDFDLNTDEAVFEVPYGVVRRPTVKNTSWDMARFEVPVQKWLDLSEDNYGVGVLNDGRYGVSVEGSSVGVSISKTPIYPDFNSDSEVNSTVISVYPHKGDWRQAMVYRRAYELNVPLIVTKGGGSGSKSFVKISDSNVILESLKRSEDGRGVVLRLYNVLNSRGECEIDLWFSPKSASSTNILEDEVGQSLSVENDRIRFSYGNHEIVTLKLT